MSKNLNTNNEVSSTLYLIKDLDPFFFKLLIDILGNSNNNLLIKNLYLSNYFKNLILLNILSTEIIKNQLFQKYVEEERENNLIYSKINQIDSLELSNKDMKIELRKKRFFGIKNIHYDSLLYSETFNLIENFKKFVLI